MAAVEKATEVVAEAADEIADGAEFVADTARGMSPSEIRLALISLALGLVGGIFAGGYWVNYRLRGQYEKIAEDEISQMRDHFRARMVAREEKPDLVELKEKVAEVGYDEVNHPAEPGAPNVVTHDVTVQRELVQEEVVHNVFEENQPPETEWDYQAEIRTRTEERPYVIHRDEQHEKGFTETTLTYYEGDDVLCDERDTIVDNRDELIGECFQRFGHGSEDANIVYVRNEALGVEIELIRSPNAYAEEVHGFKHSDDDPSIRRKAHYDDE